MGIKVISYGLLEQSIWSLRTVIGNTIGGSQNRGRDRFRWSFLWNVLSSSSVFPKVFSVQCMVVLSNPSCEKSSQKWGRYIHSPALWCGIYAWWKGTSRGFKNIDSPRKLKNPKELSALRGPVKYQIMKICSKLENEDIDQKVGEGHIFVNSI